MYSTLCGGVTRAVRRETFEWRLAPSQCTYQKEVASIQRQYSSLLIMARKKAQKKKQETTLVPHRTPNLSALLERAKSGDAAQAVKAYLDAGGSADVLVQVNGQQMSLLLFMALHNSHPHVELAESVSLLVEAGADINAKPGLDGDGYTALMHASQRRCCAAALQAFLQNGADVLMTSTRYGVTALHLAAVAGRTDSCELLLARESSLVHMRDVDGHTALIKAAAFAPVDTLQLLL
jgi:ankyrin repeat protein